MAKLVIVSGLSGAGKDTVIEGLKQKSNFSWVITTTTRPMRLGESQEHPYHFISEEEFKKKIEQGDFIEWANVYDHLYGTQYQDFENSLKSSAPIVLLKNDYQGAEAIKNKYPQASVIFIVPPSKEILEQRLRKRGQDSEEVIQRRLAEMDKELDSIKSWPNVYLVVNEEGKIEDTINKVYSIINSQ